MKTLLPNGGAFAFIFPVNVKRNESYNLNEITITEKNSNSNPIGFILRNNNGVIEKQPITSMTSTTNNTIIEFNNNPKIMYNLLNPAESFVKKLYFKKEYSPLNFWTKKRDGVEDITYPRVFKYHSNGESETTMKGGDMNRIQLKSAVYGETNKKFFYQYDIEIDVNGPDNISIKSITFNKIDGEYNKEYDVQEGGAWWNKIFNPLTWGKRKSATINPTVGPQPAQSEPRLVFEETHEQIPARQPSLPLSQTPSTSTSTLRSVSAASGSLSGSPTPLGRSVSTASAGPPSLPPSRSLSTASRSSGSSLSGPPTPPPRRIPSTASLPPTPVGHAFPPSRSPSAASAASHHPHSKIEFQINTKNNYPEGCRAFFNILPPEFKKLFSCMIIQSQFRGEVNHKTGNIDMLTRGSFGNKFVYANNQTNNGDNYVIYIDDNPVLENHEEDKSDTTFVREYPPNMSIIKLKADKFGGITNYISYGEKTEKIDGREFIDHLLVEIINRVRVKSTLQKIIVIFDFDCTLLYSHAFKTLMGDFKVFNKDFSNYLQPHNYDELFNNYLTTLKSVNNMETGNIRTSEFINAMDKEPKLKDLKDLTVQYFLTGIKNIRFNNLMKLFEKMISASESHSLSHSPSISSLTNPTSVVHIEPIHSSRDEVLGTGFSSQGPVTRRPSTASTASTTSIANPPVYGDEFFEDPATMMSEKQLEFYRGQSSAAAPGTVVVSENRAYRPTAEQRKMLNILEENRQAGKFSQSVRYPPPPPQTGGSHNVQYFRLKYFNNESDV